MFRPRIFLPVGGAIQKECQPNEIQKGWSCAELYGMLSMQQLGAEAGSWPEYSIRREGREQGIN